MVNSFTDVGKYKTDKFIIFFEKENTENEFSFGDAEFQVPEGLFNLFV